MTPFSFRPSTFAITHSCADCIKLVAAILYASKKFLYGMIIYRKKDLIAWLLLR